MGQLFRFPTMDRLAGYATAPSPSDGLGRKQPRWSAHCGEIQVVGSRVILTRLQESPANSGIDPIGLGQRPLAPLFDVVR